MIRISYIPTQLQLADLLTKSSSTPVSRAYFLAGNIDFYKTSLSNRLIILQEIILFVTCIFRVSSVRQTISIPSPLLDTVIIFWLLRVITPSTFWL